ncbi:MAG TPA: hypothetical protein VNN07_13970 [Candidatus Tectomicrobia bacterium]|nr:hypothetical protein [Candidatus Tectomicrobia bacterium]
MRASADGLTAAVRGSTRTAAPDMRARATCALLVLAISMAGCGVRHDLAGDAWAKPDATIQQVTLDEIECARLARDAGQTPELIVGGLADVGRYVVEERQRGAAYSGCMTAKGYRPTAS